MKKWSSYVWLSRRFRDIGDCQDSFFQENNSTFIQKKLHNWEMQNCGLICAAFIWIWQKTYLWIKCQHGHNIKPVEVFSMLCWLAYFSLTSDSAIVEKPLPVEVTWMSPYQCTRMLITEYVAYVSQSNCFWINL